MPDRWTPRVTVAAVIEQRGRFLLVEEHTARGLRLNNPAGHLDPGESLVAACSRETLEETAYRFRPTALVGVYLSGATVSPSGTGDVAMAVPADGPRTSSDKATYLRFAFCGELGAFDPERSLDQGIVRTVWMDIGELRASQARHRSPALLRCVEDYLGGARHALQLLASDFDDGGNGG